MSAGLDDEDDAAERAAARRHLAGCVGCRRWQDEAVIVTRLARTGLVGPGTVVEDWVLAAAPGPGRRRLVSLLRAGLGVLGVVQLILGVLQMTGAAAGHTHTAQGTDPSHLWHESAAWNTAIGAGFTWIAASRARPNGLMPTLTAFVAVLTLLSINDLIVGSVNASRLLSHGFLVSGYLILLALSHRGLNPSQPPFRRGENTPRWRAQFDEDPPAPRPVLRPLSLVPANGRVSADRTAA